MTDLINKEGLKLPLVALRDMVVFPRVSTSLDVGRKESVAAVRSAALNRCFSFLAVLSVSW